MITDITDYDVTHEDAGPLGNQIPNYEKEFNSAKVFLQTASSATGDNLYDHLTEVLNKILAERPENVIDFFEEYSRKVKEQRFKPLTDHLEDIYVQPGRFSLANKILPILSPLPPGEPSTVDPEDLELADMSNNNLIELLYYLEQCGIGLPRSEMIFVMISMRNLVHTKPIASIRFWGKIFGTISNYLVVETMLKEEEYMKRNENYQEEQAPVEVQDEMALNRGEAGETSAALLEIEKRAEMGGEEGSSKYPRPLPPEPLIHYEELPEPPPEPSGVGVNKKVFYVCNDIGESWTELPDVTPKQIRTARQIYKSFTGDLEAEIQSYPEFPGKEKEYLRVQIARISAGTQIAPLGYFTFGGAELGEGGEEEDEFEEAAGGASKTHYSINPRYDPPPLTDLLDQSMSFWVHTEPYILPQGRTTWWNPNPMPDLGEEPGEGYGEEEEEVKPRGERVEPETGPPLLTPLSEDAVLETVPPWSVRVSSKILEGFALAVVRSNIWPGAYCFSNQGKVFRNVYLGFGHKYVEHNFSPLPLPAVQQEYPIGPEILEILDPTGAEEEQWRIDHLPKPKVIPVGEEAEGEEEQEEEEEEEDED